MKRGAGATPGAALLAAAALILLACPAQHQGQTPVPPPTGPEPAPTWLSEATPPAEPAVAMVAPVEAGFTFCCGSDHFRMEIECGEMLKRCYEHKGGTWRQTYGRHCKEQLGESCYLELCDSKCR
jgi:hypothetical protein